MRNKKIIWKLHKITGESIADCDFIHTKTNDFEKSLQVIKIKSSGWAYQPEHLRKMNQAELAYRIWKSVEDDE